MIILLAIGGIFAAGLVGGLWLHRRYAKPETLPQYIWCQKMQTAANLAKGQNPFPAGLETLTLDINHENYQRLAFKRKQAFRDWVLISSEEDFVPAKATWKGQSEKIKIRLKGDLPDHLEGDKWSFRIHVKGESTLMGMKRFSLHQPSMRNYLYEWMAHEMLREEGLISLRYKFVNLVVNGKDLGLYALEEHFEKRLLEHNQRREGVILKFDEKEWWRERIRFDERELPGASNYPSAEIDAFSSNKIRENPVLQRQFETGRNFLEGFRMGLLKAKEVFDIPQMATYIAICDLMGTPHGLHTNQMRFYYNVLSDRLEPIPFDMNAGHKLERLGGTFVRQDNYEWDGGGKTGWLDPFFDDPEVVAAYSRTLARISRVEYLSGFLSAYDSAIQKNLAFLRTEYPCWEYNPGMLSGNQAYIRRMLHPQGTVRAFTKSVQGNTIHLEVGNAQRMPIEAIGLAWKDSIFQPFATPLFLRPRPKLHRIRFHEVPITLIAQIKGNDSLSLCYRVPGMRDTLAIPIRTWPHFAPSAVPVDRQPIELSSFPFLALSSNGKQIEFRPGRWTLNRPLVIPAGYQVYAGPGVVVDLQKGGYISSRSPVRFTGDASQPVTFISTDSLGLGLQVSEAETPSELKWVRFVNLGESPGRLTGAVTFYDTKVNFTACSFLHGRAEDALNLVKCDFLMSQCRFDENQADALDSDFSKGTLKEVQFTASGNDALDGSGSQLFLYDLDIRSAGDKGISVGERSFVEGHRIRIDQAAIGVAGKDQSSVTLTNAYISHSRSGIAAYQKKSEFGPAEVSILQGQLEEVPQPHLVEEGSTVTFNGTLIVPTPGFTADSIQ